MFEWSLMVQQIIVVLGQLWVCLSRIELENKNALGIIENDPFQRC